MSSTYNSFAHGIAETDIAKWVENVVISERTIYSQAYKADQWMLLWALGIAHMETIVWWSLKQITAVSSVCPWGNGMWFKDSMDEILPYDPSIYWTVFTAVVRRNLKVWPLKWKLLKSTTLLWYCFTLQQTEKDLRFQSANNIIRWDPLNGSYWVTFLRVAYRRVGGLLQVDKGGSCASSSSFTLSTLYLSYVDPLSTLHGANISPTLTPHGPYIARSLTLVIFTYSKIHIAIFNENSKQTKTNVFFCILGRIGWSKNSRDFGIKIVQNPQVWKGLLCYSQKWYLPSENPVAIFSCMEWGIHLTHQAWPHCPL